MSEKRIELILAENISDSGYVNEAALALTWMLAEIQKVDALMIRIQASQQLPRAVLDRQDFNRKSLGIIAEKLKVCLDVAGDMLNCRDMADANSCALFDEANKGLDMIIKKRDAGKDRRGNE